MLCEFETEDGKPLLIKRDEVEAISRDGEVCILYTKAGNTFRVAKTLIKLLPALASPTITTMEQRPISVNLKLVRSAVLVEANRGIWHYQLKFADDGFLEVYCDMPIEL